MAQFVRVYAALPGSPVADDTFDPAAPPEVRMEIEASNTEWAGAQAYAVGGWVRDFGSGATAALGPINGAIQDANWASQNQTFIFPLPAAITGPAAAGGLVEVRGWARTGAPGPGAEAEFSSTEFIWT